jgi:peptidyl-prolyl cis-trans isomerase C
VLSNYRILSHIYLVFIIAVLVCSLCSAAAAGPEDTVLATIGTEKVTEADLQQMVNSVPEQIRHLYLTPEGRKKSLEYLVNIYVLAAEAQKQGMDKSPEVRRMLDFTKKDLLARLYLEESSKKVAATTDDEAKAYFEKNKAQFSTPQKVHLRHILVKTEKDANNTLKKLKKGDKFDSLARKVSICPSKGQGGDLGWMEKGALLPEVEEAAFSMEKGQISGPVKSKWGYHVLFVEDKVPAQQFPFEQVKDQVVQKIDYQKQQEHYEKLAKSLRDKMNVKVTAAPSGPKVVVPSKSGGPTAAPKN